MLRGSDTLLYFLELLYQVYAESLVGEAQEDIFDDTVLPILEDISVERHPKICLLHASKAPTTCPDAVCHVFTEDYVREASVVCDLCRNQYVTSTCYSILLHESKFLHDRTTSI